MVINLQKPFTWLYQQNTGFLWMSLLLRNILEIIYNMQLSRSLVVHSTGTKTLELDIMYAHNEMLVELSLGHGRFP